MSRFANLLIIVFHIRSLIKNNFLKAKYVSQHFLAMHVNMPSQRTLRNLMVLQKCLSQSSQNSTKGFFILMNKCRQVFCYFLKWLHWFVCVITSHTTEYHMIKMFLFVFLIYRGFVNCQRYIIIPLLPFLITVSINGIKNTNNCWWLWWAHIHRISVVKTLIITPVCSDTKRRFFHLINEHNLQIRNLTIQDVTSF